MRLGKKLMVTLMLIAVVTAMAIPASAANVNDIDIIEFSFTSRNLSVIPYAEKQNTTPLYVYITNIGYGNVGIYGAAYGYDAEGDYKGNFTIYDGQYVSEVLLFEGTKHSIRSGIYERLNGQGTCYAAPAFRCSYVIGNETIWTGKWSPDSTREYFVAEAV